MNPCLRPSREPNFWSKLSDTFPFNHFVDMACFIVILLFWFLWEKHNEDNNGL